MQSTDEIQQLLDKYLGDQLTKSELIRFRKLLQNSSNQAQLASVIEAVLQQQRYNDRLSVDKDKLFEQLIQKSRVDGATVATARSVFFLKAVWFRYAAAIILVFGVGAYLYIDNLKDQTSGTISASVRVQNDILPGSNRAVLTLSDGSYINLDSADNGQLTLQHGTSVVKKNGQIIYDPKNISAKEVLYNTMTTPRGGQYKLTLPDGTRVWLNAASSITFPIAFVGNERRVKASGEIYLEVTKNRKQPFIVDLDGKVSVEVLGTSFNVNCYEDENAIRATLIEGSVKLVKANQSTVITPGQQAVASSDSNMEIVSVDIEQVIAWKNGRFNFNNADLSTVMRQLGRWYDIEIKYEGNVRNELFQGELTRDLTLSQVLKILGKMEIKYRLEGKTLVVTG